MMIPNGSRGEMHATGSQLRAARGLVDWSQSDLAEAAGVSLPTVKRVERDLGFNVSDETRTKLVRALEVAGVIFVEENGDGPGVRLRKKKAPAEAPKPADPKPPRAGKPASGRKASPAMSAPAAAAKPVSAPPAKPDAASKPLSKAEQIAAMRKGGR